MKAAAAASLVCLLLAGAAVSARAAISEAELKAKIEEATRAFKDVTMLGTVVYKDKRALTKVDSGYARLYEFKTATVSLKAPDKLRTEGKLGMVRFEYIINGCKKTFRAPTVKINKKEDFTDDPAKLQSALDIGLVTPSLWNKRRVTVVADPEAESNGEIKLELRWLKGDMTYYVWIDADNLYLKRFEKRDSGNNLQVRTVYTNHRKVDDVIWIPTRVDMFAPDGTKAGASEFSEIKVNTGLADSLFE